MKYTRNVPGCELIDHQAYANPIVLERDEKSGAFMKISSRKGTKGKFKKRILGATKIIQKGGIWM